MRALAVAGLFAMALVGACGGRGAPRSVDPHWVERCDGGSSTNLYGLSRERACLATAKGYESAGDEAAAAAYYKRTCELGVGTACVDWSRLLLTRGNVEGARFVLSHAAACDNDESAAACGWALVASDERDAPARPDDVAVTLRKMCEGHRVKTACKRLREMGDAAPPAPTAPPPTP